METKRAQDKWTGGQPRFEVADIFREYIGAFRKNHSLTFSQEKVVRDIIDCRTEVMGECVELCLNCGDEQTGFLSCRNRHCPKCQGLAQIKWIEARKLRTLPTHHFHVVFTLPSQLRPLALANRAELYSMLFAAASKTLLEFGESHLNGQLGLTAVLHTWTRDLQFHPHLHCIVTGGALSHDCTQWNAASENFLFSVKSLSEVFRAKFLDLLDSGYQKDLLLLGGALIDSNKFEALKTKLRRKKWVVYCKRSFKDAEGVLEYLGRYTHRVAISNHRLLEVTTKRVLFKTKFGKTESLDPVEFIRRFLLHLLPHQFVRIRHFGLNAACNAKTKLEEARLLLGAAPVQPTESAPEAPQKTESWLEALQRLNGVNLKCCRKCQSRAVIRTLRFTTQRAPP